MTERDWLTSADPLGMLDELFPLRGVDSTEPQPRRSRLYLIACARRAWGSLPGVCRAVVTAAERVYARRETDRKLRDEVYPHAEALVHCRGEAEAVNAIGRGLVDLGHARAADVWADADVESGRWSGFAHLAFYPFYRSTPNYHRIPAELHSAELLREVFGNPAARRPPLEAAWFTENVVRLAAHADAAADFAVLPILADALQEAGCDRADVLDHLRGTCPHVRGCWVIEEILGRR
jgi:hypothetical protein